MRKKIIRIVLVIIILLAIFALVISRNAKNNVQQYAKDEGVNYAIEENVTLNVEKKIAKTNEEVNAPKMGAGMIPIFWNEAAGKWQITTKTASDWYDYFSNKPAYMMLSNNYYKSEEEPGINIANQLASKHVGETIDAEKLGSIYVWIPRFAYGDTTMGYLKETGVINAQAWQTPSVFTVPTNKNIELTGIWVEKDIQNYANLSNINDENNIYGIIANEVVHKIDEDTINILSEYNKYHNIANNIGSIENENRTYIQVIDSTKTTELVAEAEIVGKTVKINIIKNNYEIEKIINEKTGEEVQNYEYQIEKKQAIYSFIVIDKSGNIITCSVGNEENPPDLTGFNVDRTYIVTYEGDINSGTAKEYSKQPISEILEEGYTVDANKGLISGEIDFDKIDETHGEWYNYSKQKWANIVTRNNGVEAYYVWIPRYAYALNTEEQTTDVIFVNTENAQAKTGKQVDLTKYILPEAFTWNGTELPGYWMGKYQISDGTAVDITATITPGVNDIKLDISNTVLEGEAAHYDIVLRNNGEIFYKIEDTSETSFTFSEETTGKYLFNGTYEITIMLFNEMGQYVGDKVVSCTLNSFSLTKHIYAGANIIRITEIANNAVTEPLYDIIISKDGAEVNRIENLSTNECEFTKDSTGTRLEAGIYEIKIILKNQNGDYRGEAVEEIEVYNQPEVDRLPNPPDVTGFGPTTTYIVVYDENGLEHTSQSIAEVMGEDGQVDESKIDGVWYNYAEQKWANIVTRNNGAEAYFTWIPRYEYRAYSYEQITDVYFIGTDQTEATHGYIIPEAFTWNETPISGYWMGKYQITDAEAVDITATVTTGVSNINLEVSNPVLSGDEAKYDITLKKDGEEIYKINRTSNTTFEFSESATGTYLFSGTYSISVVLYDTENHYIGEKVVSCTLNTFSITEHIYAGANIIRITEIANNAVTEPLYDIIISKDGAEVNRIENLSTNECEFTTDSTGARLEAGTYSAKIILKNQNGDYRGETTVNNIEIYNQPEVDRAPNPPDVTGFEPTKTYIVVYDEAGNETSTQSIADVMGEDGQIDESKINGVWYNYAEQKWANIVTRNNEKEAYFTWIPRYEYRAYSYEQITDVYFIGTDQTEATNGYIIPEAFTWNGTPISGYWMGKYQLST